MGTRITEQPVGEIRPGDHAAFSFATAEEQAQVIGPFLHDGLDAREKVIYISGLSPREITQATEQGHAAVRLTADMSWVLDGPGGYPLMLGM
jgi:hypothetical protein